MDVLHLVSLYPRDFTWFANGSPLLFLPAACLCDSLVKPCSDTLRPFLKGSGAVMRSSSKFLLGPSLQTSSNLPLVSGG